LHFSLCLSSFCSADFEHVALPRYIIEKKKGRKRNIIVRIFRRLFMKGNQQFQRAEPGEDRVPTALYRPWATPHGQLGDWGLGVGLYFSTLRAICVMTFLAGLLNLINIRYYASQEYSGGQKNAAFLLRGSAICTDRRWVVCPDCDSKANNLHIFRRADNTTASFYMQNHCEAATLNQGLVNWASLILVIIGIAVLNIYLKQMEVAYDEDEQTAQDYSVVITNPPPDATDPEEWRAFFHDKFDGAHVTVCTVAVENDLLVRSLVERREILRRIEMMVEPGTSMDQLTLAGLAAKEERSRRFFGNLKAKFVKGLPEYFGRLAVLTAKVQGLAQQDFPASSVFLTFETEADQRRVLSALTTGAVPARRNFNKNIASHHLFRGDKVLHVAEPDEPNTIRWQDLNENWKDRMRQQAFTTLATVIAIFMVAFIVYFLNERSPTFTAYGISIFNTMFPMFAKYLTNIEAHSSDGGKQRSLYFKIACKLLWYALCCVCMYEFVCDADCFSPLPHLCV
jgi:hypothetical protein